jgi:hypothetical protein
MPSERPSMASFGNLDALGHLVDVARAHGTLGLHPTVEVCLARDLGTADLEHVAEAGGGEKPGRCALALEDGIGCDRRAVEHDGNLVWGDACLGEHLVDAAEEASRRVGRHGS